MTQNWAPVWDLQAFRGGAVISEDQQNIYQRYQTLPTFGMAGGFFWDRFLLDLGSSSLPFNSRSKMNKNGITRINWAKILVHWLFSTKQSHQICHRYIIGVSCFSVCCVKSPMMAVQKMWHFCWWLFAWESKGLKWCVYMDLVFQLHTWLVQNSFSSQTFEKAFIPTCAATKKLPNISFSVWGYSCMYSN